MSLDVYLSAVRICTVHSANITHNLGGMAKEAGIYQHLWRPEELDISLAKDLIEPLTNGIKLMESDRPRFEAFNASNGWGLYEHFLPFVEEYRDACIENPEAEIEVSR